MGTPVAPDPAREERLARWDELIRRARVSDPRAGLEDLGLSDEELAQARADFAAVQVPPIAEPAGLGAAIKALTGLGLLAVTGGGSDAGGVFTVHRWTAATLAAPWLTAPEQMVRAHEAAAAYWRWRVATRPQDPQQGVADALEERYHLHAAGDVQAAAAATAWAGERLVTWGAWGWAGQLYAETASWFPEGSGEHAAWHGELGGLALRRGQYGQALERYRQALAVFEELGDRAGMAGGYHQLGVIAQERGEYDQALNYYRQSLTINEELGDRAGMASGYSQLGVLYTEIGEAAEAVPYSLHSLAIRAELQLPAIAIDLHWLGRQRQALGEQEFTAILARHLDPASLAIVLGWLDQNNNQ